MTILSSDKNHCGKNEGFHVYLSTVSTKRNDAAAPGMPGNSHERHIGILIDEGHFSAGVSAVNRCFQIANKFVSIAGGQPPYRISLLSRQGGQVISSSTIAVWTQPLEAHSLRDFHAIFVASHDMRTMPDPRLWPSRWLTEADEVIYDREWDAPYFAQYFVVDEMPNRRSTIPILWFGYRSGEEQSSIQMAAQLALAQIATDRADDISIQMASSESPPVEMIANHDSTTSV